MKLIHLPSPPLPPSLPPSLLLDLPLLRHPVRGVLARRDSAAGLESLFPHLARRDANEVLPDH